MNTALLDFIILLLILRDNMHAYLMKEFFGEPFTKMYFYTAYNLYSGEILTMETFFFHHINR
jgi:hypothetical protein